MVENNKYLCLMSLITAMVSHLLHVRCHIRKQEWCGMSDNMFRLSGTVWEYNRPT